MKTCTVCGAEKPLEEFYANPTNRTDGRFATCKLCCHARTKAWRAANPNKVKVIQDRHYRTTRDKRIAEMEEYRKTDAFKASTKRSARKHRAKRAAATKRWIADNQERYKALKRVASRNYKARKRAADGHHTAGDIEYLFAEQCGVCPVCGSRLADGYHVDHIVPLIAGGSNWPQNLQLLCPSCNQDKKDMSMDDFLDMRENA